LLALVPVGAAGLPIRRELELGRLLTGGWRCRLRRDAAVAIISAAIISAAISVAIISAAIISCTPLISAVDASDAAGC
jgi:hypothetical protein